LLAKEGLDFLDLTIDNLEHVASQTLAAELNLKIIKKLDEE
jgi:hypothetical protein